MISTISHSGKAKLWRQKTFNGYQGLRGGSNEERSQRIVFLGKASSIPASRFAQWAPAMPLMPTSQGVGWSKVKGQHALAPECHCSAREASPSCTPIVPLYLVEQLLHFYFSVPPGPPTSHPKIKMSPGTELPSETARRGVCHTALRWPRLSFVFHQI